MTELSRRLGGCRQRGKIYRPPLIHTLLSLDIERARDVIFSLLALLQRNNSDAITYLLIAAAAAASQIENGGVHQGVPMSSKSRHHCRIKGRRIFGQKRLP